MEDLLQRFDDWLGRQGAGDIMRFVALIIGGCFALFLLLAMLASCKSAQVTERVVYRDSVQTIFIHDTLTKIVRDSNGQKTEQSGGMVIEFAQGGGDYNVQTGQASNVQRVTADYSQIEQASTTHASDSTAASTAAAMQEGEELTTNKEQMPTKSKWQQFCNVWTISTLCGLLLALAVMIWRNWGKIAAWAVALFIKMRK